jgi:Ca2+-transporting ATPase
MSYVLAIHVPIIGMALVPSFWSDLPIFLMPIHIVFLELIIDPICSVAFELEQEEKGIMTRPPRAKNKSFFGKRKISMSLLKGFVLLLAVCLIYFFCLRQGLSHSETRAVSFLTLVLGNLFLILTSLSDSRVFLSVFKEKNYAAWIILIVSIVLSAIIYLQPEMKRLFDFEVPEIHHFISSIIAAFTALIIFELIKLMRN